MADSIYGEEGGVNMDTALADAANQQGYILNSGNNTTALGNIYSDPNTNPGISIDANSPVSAGSVYKNQTPTSLADLQKFLSDNKGLITAGGAALGLMGANQPQYGKTGYQGAIPALTATRTMVAAPPTREQGYRPGAGGINYGGDVTYTRTPGIDPWAFLSGTSGTAAGANLTTPTGTATGTATGITTTPGGTNVTNTGGTNTKVDANAVANWRKGMTDQQYLSAINQWIADHPNLSTADLNTALNTFKVSQTDLQTALGQNKALSAADIYALSHGMGLKEANAQQTAGIKDWIAKNPYATADQIKDAIKGSGVNTAEINEVLSTLPVSGAYKSALTEGMGLNQLYKNILDYQASGHTPEEIAAAKEQYKVSDADLAAAAKFAAEQKYTPQVQAAIPAHSFSDSVNAILADQKALENADVNKGLTNLGLISTPKVEASDVYQPVDNTDYSYMQFAEGGMAKGRYLQGETDGMADELPARIGQEQPAALSHGEFVVPADVVSHLGNGNSDAGAKKLYQMMDKIRMARTGTKQQGKKINPDKFMPGGLASAKFAGGGDVSGTAISSGLTGVESNLSNWAGPYVTNMLGQGQALANMAYQPYMGQLTAGESPLQTGAFKTAAGLTTPTSIGTAATTAGDIANTAKGLTYSPVTSSFGKDEAAAYMNPYLESALKPQLEEARRQSQITQTQNAAKMTQAGAFGGGRQAILDAETQRALGANLANITGTGYNTAFDKAMAQFNADQARKAQEAQFGATYGLQGLQTGLQGAQTQGQLGSTEAQTGLANLNAQLTAGNAQRGIEAEGVAADKAAFEEARANPYKMVQFQQSLLQGLPLAAQNYNLSTPSALAQAAGGATTVADLLSILTGQTAAKKI